MYEGSLVDEVRRIGEDVAGRWAGDVDKQSRFPSETMDAVRKSGVLGALVPSIRGGGGASMVETAQAVTALSEHCASSGLILAMHQIQVAVVLRHGSPQLLDELLPRLVSGELLLGNGASEVGLAGDRRSSSCALESVNDSFHLEKQASTVSYGEYADGILVTARKDADSPAHEQVMAVCLLPDLKVEPQGDWDTLGLRGTCSRPCLLVADFPRHMVITEYSDVFKRTSLPVSSVLLSSVWLGLAEAAGRQAHRSVRAQARKQRLSSPDAGPPTSALRLAELSVILHEMREVLAGGAEEYERVKDTPEVETLRVLGRMDNIKLASSTLVLAVVQKAMAICGLQGFKNNSDFSMTRIMRDAAAAPLMVNNDRALVATAQALLLRKDL
jgi:acyl-CoA dehydrogenase